MAVAGSSGPLDLPGAAPYSRPVTHLFVGPHPDDVALSCGGLIASLRSRGETVALVTVFSGAGAIPTLTPYQREALGFGDASPDLDPQEAMAERRVEDEAYVRLAGASLSFVNRPDAVFRGYEGADQLMGAPWPDDPPPVEELRREIARLEPERVYFPLSVGGHVDHRLVRRAGVDLAAELEAERAGRLVFYEDFPYIVWREFERLDQLPPDALASLPPNVSLEPEYVEVGDSFDCKLRGIRAYSSQLPRLFADDAAMERTVRDTAARVGRLGGVGPAERYWRAVAR